MTETTETTAPATPAKSNHVLTILVDLSHGAFKDRGVLARVALAEVLQGCARAALHGAEAVVVQDGAGDALGIFLITEDVDGEGKAAFRAAVEGISKMQKAPEEKQQAVNG